jgi:hypothetical protein
MHDAPLAATFRELAKARGSDIMKRNVLPVDEEVRVDGHQSPRPS